MDFRAAVEATAVRYARVGWWRPQTVRLRPTGAYTLALLVEQQALRAAYQAEPTAECLRALAATFVIGKLPRMPLHRLGEVIKAGVAYREETAPASASSGEDLGLLAARLLSFYRAGEWWEMPLYQLEAYTVAAGELAKERGQTGGHGGRQTSRLDGHVGFAKALQTMEQLHGD